MQAELAPHAPLLRTVFTKNLRDGRRGLLLWSLGLFLTVLMYAAFWPSIQANAGQMSDYIEKMPEAIRNMMGGADFGTPVGYVQTELFSLLGPALLLVYAIGAGARAIAGEEEDGSLDLLLSAGVPRRRVVLDKAGALVAGTLTLSAVAWLSLVIVGPLYDLRLPLEGLTAATANLFLLATAFGMVSLLAGVAWGSRGAAIGLASGLVVAMFVLNTLAPSVHALEPFRFVSAFHYYSGHTPLRAGFDAGDVLVLACISVACLLAAVWTFERRDLKA
jgi:ABC-2 type transport system permease protein